MWWRGAAATILLLLLAITLSYITVPTTNTTATHFDTIIVLGSPPDPDGSPSPEQRERVMAAVREFRAGHSQHIIVSGGAPHSILTEASVMAAIARSAGVPPKDIIEEPQAQNTIQNIFYSEQIMQAHGWTTAEVVSSPSHLPRAALILEHWPLGWKLQAARWPPEYDRARIAPYYIYEAVGTTLLRWFGFRHSQFLPGTWPTTCSATQVPG